MPLFQNLCVIAAQTVDAFNIEQIVSFQFSQQPFILWPLEILVGLLAHKKVETSIVCVGGSSVRESLNLAAATMAEKWRLIFFCSSRKTGILHR